MGATKAVAYSLIGAIFVDLEIISTQRIVLSVVGIGIFSILLELVWLHRPARQRHEELRHRFGEQYDREVQSAVDELGMARFISTLWIAKKHDELIGKGK